ncbi:RIO1 family regulatory kinase/ATPase [Glutamicibacter uratoxydans]|uniref:RIO1 family regulatory kinase/ATPase domain-containing protein n=1 Tax=Glutamicibacter uratoxydans TaxID=43667 RepID=UPI003D6E971A
MAYSASHGQLEHLPENFEPRHRNRARWVESARDPLPAEQRHSTWPSIAKRLRGPRPYPSWLIEDAAAIDTTLGLLKTGKEGEVYLLQRATATRSVLLAAKRYRAAEHRQFNRSQSYSEGRSVRRSRDMRALKTSSSYGREVAALQWASAEFSFLVRCYRAGIPVPYPVQLDGTEILMEFIADPERPSNAAPRLQQLPRGDRRLPDLWIQALGLLEGFASEGIAHGDLSAYNLLISGERLVVIDVPQCVDLAGNINGFDYLYRDCENLCLWFTTKGLAQDPQIVFEGLLALLFTG